MKRLLLSVFVGLVMVSVCACAADREESVTSVPSVAVSETPSSVSEETSAVPLSEETEETEETGEASLPEPSSSEEPSESSEESNEEPSESTSSTSESTSETSSEFPLRDINDGHTHEFSEEPTETVDNLLIYRCYYCDYKKVVILGIPFD